MRPPKKTPTNQTSKEPIQFQSDSHGYPFAETILISNHLMSGSKKSRSIMQLGVQDDSGKTGQRTRPCRPRLAEHVSHIFIQRLLRSKTHGLSQPARDQ